MAFRPTISLAPNEHETARLGVFADFVGGSSWRYRTLHVTNQRLVISRRRVSPYFGLAIPIICLIAYGLGGFIGVALTFAVVVYLFFWQRPLAEREILLSEVASTAHIVSTSFFEKSRVVVTPRNGIGWALMTSRRSGQAGDIVGALRGAGLAVVG